MSNIKFYKPISIQRTPCAGDFVLKQSYNAWINGNVYSGPGEDENKFFTIGQDYDNSDYLNLELVAGQAHGLNISMCTISSVHVNYENLAVRDDGYGSWYVNYVDFINNIFNCLNLYTRLSASDNQYFYANHCKLDDFILIFRENGQVYDKGTLPTVYYTLQSEWGYNLRDNITDPSTNLNSFFYLHKAWSPV